MAQWITVPAATPDSPSPIPRTKVLGENGLPAADPYKGHVHTTKKMKKVGFKKKRKCVGRGDRHDAVSHWTAALGPFSERGRGGVYKRLKGCWIGLRSRFSRQARDTEKEGEV